MKFWCPKVTTICIILGTFACISKNLFFEYNFINIVQNQPKKTISRYTLRESTSIFMSTSFEELTKKFIFRCYFLISGVKSLEKVKNELKRLKTTEKSVLTSFWVCAAPESWSKYTTIGCQKSWRGFLPNVIALWCIFTKHIWIQTILASLFGITCMCCWINITIILLLCCWKQLLLRRKVIFYKSLARWTFWIVFIFWLP